MRYDVPAVVLGSLGSLGVVAGANGNSPALFAGTGTGALLCAFVFSIIAVWRTFKPQPS